MSAVSILRYLPSSQKFLTWTRRVAGTVAVASGSFHLLTRNCYFERFEPDCDGLFRHPLLKQINPLNNPNSHDCCVRRLPLSRIRPDLLEDAGRGGSALIEAFCAGIWGGYGYAIQRNLMLLSKNETNHDGVWSKSDLLSSKYEPGTIITNHFNVLSKSPNSLIMRGCLDPEPPVPKTMDNIVEIVAQVEENEDAVFFKLKVITFNGTASSPQIEDPFGGFPGWLHKQYAKLLVESGAGNCV